MASRSGTKNTKKPKVMPISISADGTAFVQPLSPPRSLSGMRSPTTTGGLSDEDLGSRGRTSSTTRRSKTTVVTRLTDSTSSSPSPSVRSSSTLGGTKRPIRQPKELKVEDCLRKMIEFVNNHNLRPILGRDLTDEELKDQLYPQAVIASKLPINLAYVNRELVMQLAVLSLYDMAVLIDDSISMEFEEGGKRKTALKCVLNFLADIYGAVSEKKRGIRAIRFLNGNDDLRADNIQTSEQIDKVIDQHEFEGLTRIGTGLMQKILKPFVFEDEKWSKTSKEARKLKKLERPLLIMVITDGAVEGEPPLRLKQAIKSVVDSLKKAKFETHTKAIAFQFARVGDDPDAQKFLEDLDNKSKVKDYVDTLSGEDLMEITGLRSKDQALTEKHQRRMIKLLLGPISPKYDEMASTEKKLAAKAEAGYNSADDFDDDEEEDDDDDDDDDTNDSGDDKKKDEDAFDDDEEDYPDADEEEQENDNDGDN